MPHTEDELVRCKFLRGDLPQRKVSMDDLDTIIHETFFVKSTQVQGKSHDSAYISI